MPNTAQTIAIAALAGAGVTLQGCAKGGFKVQEKNVYSNSKYLADIQHGMTVKKCKDYCSNWGKVCEDVCKKDKACALTDDVDARHFTRDVSCKKKCVGFNMHGEEHCTLFGSNVDLEDGGKGTFYAAPGSMKREGGKEEEEEKKDEKEDKDEKKEKKVEKKEKKEKKDEGNSYGGNTDNGNYGGSKDGGNYGESNSNSYGGNKDSGNSNSNSYGSNNNNGNYGGSKDGGNYGESNSNSYGGNNNGNYGGSKDGNSYGGSKDNYGNGNNKYD